MPLQMHEHNVVHRDLTSYNILLDFGRPWQVKVRGEGVPEGRKDGKAKDKGLGGTF